MKSVLFLGLTLLTSAHLFSADALEVASGDNLKDVLDRQVGQVVEVRLKSGDKFAGKVASVGDKVLHLSQLSGQEFFDAVIDVKDVSAVVVRVRQK